VESNRLGNSESCPSTKDVIQKLDKIQKQLDDFKPKLLTTEHVAQGLGWASLKQDLKEMKADIQQIKQRLSLP